MYPLLLLLMRLAPLSGKSADRSSLSERRLEYWKTHDVCTTFSESPGIHLELAAVNPRPDWRDLPDILLLLAADGPRPLRVLLRAKQAMQHCTRRKKLNKMQSSSRVQVIAALQP